MGSFWTRDQTHVYYIGRQVPYLWAPREVQDIFIPHMSVIGWSSLQCDNKEANFSFFFPWQVFTLEKIPYSILIRINSVATVKTSFCKCL